MARRSLGRRFGWLWAAFAVSTFGTSLAFDAFRLVAILGLHAGPAEVAVLAAAGRAVGAVAAVPLGLWVERRRKRPVMVASDLIRGAVLLSIPVAWALGRLSFAQLLVVSVVAAAADIAFRAASGAFLKALVRPDDLLVANGRLESTTWTATALGPSLGGAAIGLLGPMATVVADAVSYLLSAAGIGAIGRVGGGEPHPVPPSGATTGDGGARGRATGLLDGWRYILRHPVLRPLLLNTVVVNGLILAPSPLLAVLMLGRLGFAPWQYGMALAAPCVGGLVGSRLAPRCVARFGPHRVLRTAGALRACWPLGLALVRPGVAGLVIVLVTQLGLITCVGLFNPVLATYRLDHTPADRVARTLAAWSVTNSAAVAVLVALWGVLAGVTGARTAIAVAGLLLLATPLLLPPRPTPEAGTTPEPGSAPPVPAARR